MVQKPDVLVGATTSSPERVADQWLGLLRRHLLSARRCVVGRTPPRVAIADPSAFIGSARRGLFGSWRYCHLAATPNEFVDSAVVASRTCGHAIVLQMAGTSLFDDSKRVYRLRPGAMLLIGSPRALRVTNESHVEQLLLLRPLQPQSIGPLHREMHLCDAADGLARTAFRWAVDVCLRPHWQDCEAADAIAAALSRLLGQVLLGAAPAPATSSEPALTRDRIEEYIALRLNEPGLDAESIAAALGCSKRTLHRTFQRPGEETLSRNIWRRRLQACAEALGNPDSGGESLLDLAMKWGFNSASHFSAAFRATYGVSPSDYRRARLGR
jgi:AraC family transcriptional regulator, positive regulator of tynA and feaB